MTGLSVDGTPVERYLTAFVWDEAKHPARRPLRDTVDKLMEGVGKLEDELKIKVSEYSGCKGQLAALARKQGGNLAVQGH